MRIWVDADACPGAVKEILYRAAERLEVETTLVANQYLRVPASRYISSVQVPGGFDVADNEIVARMAPGDLVITADIPLAAEVVNAGGAAINPRGTLYNAENISEHLARRNFMDELRSTGSITGGPAALGKTDVQAFANQLDKYLTRHIQS
jgi:uncharacterized protein YaiI (UPF0178 family)